MSQPTCISVRFHFVIDFDFVEVTDRLISAPFPDSDVAAFPIRQSFPKAQAEDDNIIITCCNIKQHFISGQ